MTDDIGRGHRAKQLLLDPLIVEAFDVIKTSLVEEWQTQVQPDIRDECWYTLQGLERFKSYLEIVTEYGTMEQALNEKDEKNARTH